VKVFFILLTFDKHDKTQLLAKFKKILYMGFIATLNFRKFKVALNPMYRTLPKVASYPAYQNSILRKKFTMPFLKYKRLNLKLRVFLAGHSVAMVTYCATKMTSTCPLVIGQCFDTMIVASSDNEW